MSLLGDAISYLKLGWSVIPIGQEKRPALPSWKPYQNRQPTEQELVKMFKAPGITGLAVICGPVSGGLVVRDFDQMEAYESWANQYPDWAMSLPTVRTARGYHVYFTAAVEGIKKLPDGELRASGGYVLLPPSRHPKGCTYEWVVPLPKGPLPQADPYAIGLADIETESTEIAERAEKTETLLKCSLLSSVLSVLSVSHEIGQAIAQAIELTLPSEEGQRNQKVFEFARSLKAIPSLADAEPKALREVVILWHQQALSFIQTKPFEDTWGEFLYGWSRVKFPRGSDPMEQILARAKTANPPQVAMQYDAQETRLLVCLCRELQRSCGSSAFFLSCRTAARLVGLDKDHVTAWRRLGVLVADRVLELVEKGTKTKAARYRYIAKE